MARVSKYAQHNEIIEKLCKKYNYRVNTVALRLSEYLGRGSKPTGAMRAYVKKHIISIGEKPALIYSKGIEVSSLKRYHRSLSDNLNNEIFTETDTNQYPENTPGELPSAWCSNKSRYLTIQEFCNKYGLNPDSVKSSKLVTHNAGHMTYNIAFDGNEIMDDFDYLGELEKALDSIPIYKPKKKKLGKEGVVSLTDLHFGAYILGLKETPDFSALILVNMLRRAAMKVNKFNYATVHIHLLGDLIESFTGLNHINVWKSLEYGHHGVGVIKMFVKMFKENFLDLIINLGKVKVIAGNHDRTSSSNKEDTDGGVAELIGWGLELLGYSVEFSPSIITHVVEDTCYILNHGHHYLTKKLSTQEICWKYGKKGFFNFVCEGHLHSRIAKLNASQLKNFNMIMDDNIDVRRQVFCSLFTGNSYSEYGGWSTKAGFTITESNGNKGVNVFDFSF
tara:strand:+ start:305 stop:1651 length:1347 start_codon:yes stop_codon:yes gene_type:complete